MLQDAFVLKLLPKYSGSIVREKAVSPKILALAPALLHAFKDPSAVEHDPTWRGRVIEHVVGTIICRKFRKVSYWQRQEAEVDFIVEYRDLLFAVEVKSGRPRRVSGLSQFIKFHPTAIPLVIDEHNLHSLLNEDFSDLMPGVDV